ncbi:DNA-binding response regulator [Sporolactobacillus inulinus]|uniref:DNA-binding response regulator n=1 Tax=Sporolactobacillus inulinus TaxID=2078 RepID=A0A4Y1ZDJ6_9BACL|nr:DNA-binding response regulator [Sporolactobacillus inulinus]
MNGGRSMRLLAVEDNTYLRQEIVRLLQEDYTVDSAEDGDEALYQAEQNIYDAIILDVMLPGLDGFEVTKQIRKKGSKHRLFSDGTRCGG